VTVGKINVVLPSFPGLTKSPTDPNNDGKYEDLNGNGYIDYKDVALEYNNLIWINNQSNLIFYYDYNGNGYIDFKDVAKLYNMIASQGVIA
jgi:PKD repeat protein